MGSIMKVLIDGNEMNLDHVNWKEIKKKPIVVHGIQIGYHFEVETLEGVMKGKPWDILIKGVNGELYPCDREIFMKTYDWKEL